MSPSGAGGPHRRASSRRRVLDLLTQTGRPMDLAELSEATGLHANTLRGHLDLLVDLGEVERSIEPRATPGRPRIRYCRSGGEPASNPYRQLATELAAGLAAGTDSVAAARAAGRHWAGSLRERAGLDPEAQLPADRAVQLATEGLTSLGFAAHTEPLGDRIYLHACPFEEVARTNPSVCRVHADLLGGLFAELGGEVEMESLDPHVRPNLCVARLRTTTNPPSTDLPPADEPTVHPPTTEGNLP